MTTRSDLDLVKACAVAINLLPPDVFHAPYRAEGDMLVSNKYPSEGGRYAGCHVYDPLRDDAQMAALVKHFKLELIPRTNFEGAHTGWFAYKDRLTQCVEGEDENLNRAIVLCIASLPATREGEGMGS